MSISLAFNPLYHVESVPNEGLLLVSEIDTVTYSGDIYSAVAEFINGERTDDEIVDKLLESKPSTPMAAAYYALQILKSRNAVVDSQSVSTEPSSLFWQAYGTDVETSKVNKGYTVNIINLTTADTSFFQRAFAESGFTYASNADLTLVISANYLEKELTEINKRLLAEKKPWMLVKPFGTIVWIGPFFHSETGCYQCLSQRLLSNREVDAYILQRGTVPITTSRGFLPATLKATAELCVLEVEKWFLQLDNPGKEAYVTSLNLRSLESAKHILTKRPQCLECAEPAYDHKEHALKPIELTSRKVLQNNDAGYRSSDPKETYHKYAHHVSPITGVVNFVRGSEHNNVLMHSYVAGHNTAVKHRNLFFLQKGLRSKSAGKGVNDDQAKVSALCEAIERYSGLYQGYEYKIMASYDDMGETAIHPNSCMLFSEAQYDSRESWNKIAGNFQHVPDRLSLHEKIDWSPVWSLTTKSFKYLPTAYCYFNYWERKDQVFCSSDSNGNAAGNSIEEAILQGLFELIERDSVAIWWYNMLRQPQVDLKSFKNSYIDDLVKHYQTINREIWVLDLTTDLGIPVFAALSRRFDKPKEDILFGFGAHISPQIALLRALTELNQFMPAVLSIDLDGKGDYSYRDPHIIHWWETATIKNQPYLLGNENIPYKKAKDYANRTTHDILGDIAFCKEKLDSLGMEILVQNQTRADINLPVVKVLVPGIRHFWKRWAPGRLYDVPVKMGWLEKPLSEDQLNPIPMFI